MWKFYVLCLKLFFFITVKCCNIQHLKWFEMSKLRIVMPPLLGTEPEKRLSESNLYCLFWEVWHQKSSGQYIITMCNLYTNAKNAFIVRNSFLENTQRSPKTQDKQNNNHRYGQQSTQLFDTSVDYGCETPAGRWESRSLLWDWFAEKNAETSEDHRSGRMERHTDLLQLSRTAAFG